MISSIYMIGFFLSMTSQSITRIGERPSVHSCASMHRGVKEDRHVLPPVIGCVGGAQGIGKQGTLRIVQLWFILRV